MKAAISWCASASSAAPEPNDIVALTLDAAASTRLDALWRRMRAKLKPVTRYSIPARHVPVRFLSAVKWPLWGVLLTAVASSLLWERGGDIFKEHHIWLPLFLLALPIAGGILIPEKPAYTVVIFALGSFPPLSDMPAIPIGLVPFLWIQHARGDLHELPHILLVTLLVTAVELTVMSIVFAPLVYLGWFIRCRLANSGLR